MAEDNSLSLSSVHTIKQFSDLTLICGDESFKAHKAYLCRHSPVIAAALTGEFIEAKTNEMVISFDLPTVKHFIDFIYMGDYDLSTYTASDILSSGCIAEPGAATDGVGKEIGSYLSAIVHDDPFVLTQSEVLASGAADSTVDDVDSEGVDSGDAAPEDSHPIRDQLLQHGLMNSIADYYAIPKLGALAIKKTTRFLTDNWSGRDFCDFVRGFTGSTGDARFYEMLSDIVMDHLSETLEYRLLDNTDIVQELSPHLLTTVAHSFRIGGYAETAIVTVSSTVSSTLGVHFQATNTFYAVSNADVATSIPFEAIWTKSSMHTIRTIHWLLNNKPIR
ncbi:hypothetical protein NPX13_g7599 [Xylaria arbuscula]|uniref:BTB domain-containing protein n=1 Tax=Xylaria arbuscula TaxID=114810 RepID=A0A9W8N9Q3_9PEZI|nr:hypothetical protein NPX13_g7599 [Xylaria arbuscula]